jgi:dephospho-CoA kinase
MITERIPGFKLGITGGIGSGKTSVCRVFDVLGIPVFSADRVARELMEKDKEIIRKINSTVGIDLYSKGSLDRMQLAKIIFNDSKLLQMINSVVHPAVFEAFEKWTVKQTAAYVIMEAAILIESGAAKYVDRIATVVAPVEQRVERVIQRNKLSKDQVMERMRNQLDDAGRIKFSDYVINNSENDMIIPEILRIHNDILLLINTRT